MTTTIERPRPSPARATGAANLRLYLLAVLAGVYLLAWWAFGSRAPAPSAELPPLAPVAGPRAPQHAPSLGPVSAPVRVAPARPGRIRTRSS